MFFEITLGSKIQDQLDLANKIQTSFGIQKKSLKKQVKLQEVKPIVNPNMITTAVNPKEYFKEFQNRSCKKKDSKKKHTGHEL